MYRQGCLTPIRQFGNPIVLAIKTEQLHIKGYLYDTIVTHIERYCIVKLFEDDVSVPDLMASTTGHMGDERKSFLSLQQPIHATAASVTPAGGRPMVPIPHLFKIHVFDCLRQLESYPINSNTGLAFPSGSSTTDWKEVNYTQDIQDTLVKQGQGVIIEWNLNKAQQIFGLSSCSSNSYELSEEINVDAWFDYDTSTTDNTKQLSSRAVTSLDDCLNDFTSDEQLSNQDSWYCPRCKQHQGASKKIDIWKLPEIMVVHLKRFSQLRRCRNKIDTFVDFPLTELDMTDRVLGHSGQESRLIYDLYAVDNHYGSLGAGHCKY